MSEPTTSQAPHAYTRLCESLASRGERPAVSHKLGELTRALTASRPGGVFLCLGHGAGEMATWVFDGMDLSGRLVIVVPNNQEADALRPLLDDDMRITVHVQDALAFLGDVRDHRFDLITDLNPVEGAGIAPMALRRLALGAFYLSPHGVSELAGILSVENAAGAGEEAAPNAAGFAFAQLPAELGVSLTVHGPQRVQTKRRGGRRARQGVTPLFSSKTPRRS